ncbi:hypothetical protein PFICI_00532 [Pestalotiopsis fici W106-1]|uniref:Heterokaryon incompatibility domain-containing protein n=1 Tax=Pestalotiopsis fici (strain W106-1 / CGMCC3.15140) TaxID=1229662 RepID=W3XL21_PESFW|nr:uncharacterized protein PFICI_00532 [Pestalotiopsis fici W106-1]ETS86704.1 hypothetical protein PFICI_00532 [Pestalotiopsis fici W106-1]
MATLYDDLQARDGVEIRLVTLEGIDKTTGKIECRLDTVRLSDGPEYRALSYCWGDASRPSDIICNGFQLSVTRNLASALVCLLSKGKANDLSLTFWIDSICINQSNHAERQAQVMLMGSIYRQAVEVIVWLGPASDNSDLAFRVCHRLSGQETGAPTRSQRRAGSREFSKRIKALYTPLTNVFGDKSINFKYRGIRTIIREMRAVHDILTRPWWSRVWIIQEVTLAKHVVVFCGDAHIYWDQLLVGVIACLDWPRAKHYIDLATAHYARVLFQARQVVMCYNHDSSRLLFHLISQCRWSKATDPRDKVYGLLGLASIDSDSSNVRVDYSQSIEDCYRTALLDIIKASGSLEILQLCRKPPGLKATYKSPQLPSWVPDLRLDASDLHQETDLHGFGPLGFQSAPGIEDLISQHPGWQTQMFSASKGSVERNPNLINDKVLMVSGLMIDTVNGIGEVLTGLKEQNDPQVTEPCSKSCRGAAKSQTPWTLIKSLLKHFSGFAKSHEDVGTDKLLLISWKRLAFSHGVEYPTGETLNRAFSATIHRSWLGEHPERTITNHNAQWKRSLSRIEAFDQKFMEKRFSHTSKLRKSVAGMVWGSVKFLIGQGTLLHGYASK